MKSKIPWFNILAWITISTLTIISVAALVKHPSMQSQKKVEQIIMQKVGSCFPSFSDEEKFVWRPCNSQYGNCEITYFSQKHSVPLFNLSYCDQCMNKNGFSKKQIDTICAQHRISSIKNVILSSRGAK